MSIPGVMRAWLGGGPGLMEGFGTCTEPVLTGEEKTWVVSGEAICGAGLEAFSPPHHDRPLYPRGGPRVAFLRLSPSLFY